MAKGSAVIVIDSDKIDFYKNYLQFMKPVSPISKLRNKQLEVLAMFLYERGEISKKVTDQSLIPKILFAPDTRNRIIELANISNVNYYGMTSIFKKLGIIKDGDISKRIIPELVNNKYTLAISFVVNDEGNI